MQRSQAIQPLQPVDVQTILCQFTVKIIQADIQRYVKKLDALFLCGGGVHNVFLIQQIKQAFPSIPVKTIQALGVPVYYVEAAIFALLAHYRTQHITGNIPSVTGAKQAVILGGCYLSA
ncbi:MAG: hypothetical protein HAW62_02235 [Endozoicomonadaceae bacterium]|nr:hypothetical protein [Endozoicomonadaceae bacterium]